MLYRNKGFLITILIAGILLIAASFLITGEELKAVLGTCMGLGTGLLGMSIANLIMMRYENKHPEQKKQIEIDIKDERHRTINDKAKAKAGDVMKWLVMALIFIMILFDIPLWVIILSLGIFVTYYVVMFVLSAKYNKEM